MKKPTNLKIGDQFKMIGRSSSFELGEIITLKEDDGTNCPHFWKADKSDWHYMNFSKLEPYAKTVREKLGIDVSKLKIKKE